MLRACSPCLGSRKMSIDIRYIDDEPRTRGWHRMWRRQLQLCGHAMQPNNNVTSANLCMDGLTFWCPVNATRSKAKGVHEKVVRRRNVLTHENWDESFDFGHIVW